MLLGGAADARARAAILAALAVPLLGALLIALAGRAPNLREAATLAPRSRCWAAC
jgi:hypothetical protein